MIHVRVLKAENLPDIKKLFDKTKIYCFSSSSRKYFIDSLKGKDKEFDVNMFRTSNISLTIFSTKMLSKGKKTFIGRVDIDLCKIFNDDAAKKIFSNPKDVYECKFPITSCRSQNATLALSFSYSPLEYKPIEFNDISKPTIHFWTSYDPPIDTPEDEKPPVEIELLQGDPINDKKNGDFNVFYTNFNISTIWDSVGNSSNNRIVPFSKGCSQVHTFKLSRIAGKYEFFLLNVFNYSGTVTLNFIEEKRSKLKKFKDGSYFIAKSNKDNIGTVKTISIKVEANKRYCLPFFMFYDKKFLEKTMNFVTFPTVNCDINSSNVIKYEYSDTFSSKVPFLTQVMDEARKSIPELKEANFIRVNSLTNTDVISLPKTIKDYNVPITNNIRFYLAGATTETTAQDSKSSSQLAVTNYWDPFFVVYEAKSGKKCQDISDSIISGQNKDVKYPAGKDFLGIKCHTTVTFNLDKIGTDKMIIFGIYCKSVLDSANSAGFYLISQVDQDKETLIFREPVYADENMKSHYALCLSLIYQNNEWEIVPIRRFFSEAREAYSYIDTLRNCKWSIPTGSRMSQSNGIINN